MSLLIYWFSFVVYVTFTYAGDCPKQQPRGTPTQPLLRCPRRSFTFPYVSNTRGPILCSPALSQDYAQNLGRGGQSRCTGICTKPRVTESSRNYVISSKGTCHTIWARTLDWHPLRRPYFLPVLCLPWRTLRSSASLTVSSAVFAQPLANS